MDVANLKKDRNYFFRMKGPMRRHYKGKILEITKGDVLIMDVKGYKRWLSGDEISEAEPKHY